MLVLARKKNQSIVVGNDIEIVVVDVAHDQVKLGIRAPKDVPVHRKEIYESVRSEMNEAVKSPLPEEERLQRWPGRSTDKPKKT